MGRQDAGDGLVVEGAVVLGVGEGLEEVIGGVALPELQNDARVMASLPRLRGQQRREVTFGAFAHLSEGVLELLGVGCGPA